MLALPAVCSSALLDIHVHDDFYDPDSPPDAVFDFLDVDNPNVVWTWGNFNGDTTSASHNVFQRKAMFKSGISKDSGQYEVQASGGAYKYLCTVHQGMTGEVGIRPMLQTPSEDTLKPIWANEFTETGKRFDVRYRIDEGKWKLWLRQTKKTRKVFGKNKKPVAVDTAEHQYDFSARTIKGKPSKKRRSGWSPPVSTVT